jgi:AraC-like DNA-binding protein/mannose-6-phosphate isomerase-like protein (cupin superfamily)
MSRSTHGEDYQSIDRPVAVLMDDYPSGFFDPAHSHTRAQLVYATAGVMILSTDDTSYIIPPQRAVWVPAGVTHEVRCRGRVRIRTLYVDGGAATGLPTACGVIVISDLLRELVLEACGLPVEYPLGGRDERLMLLIADEIARARSIPSRVPMPTDKRLVPVCKAILADSSLQKSLNDWADSVPMARRTFTRTFRRETGMSFAAWQQHVRLMDAFSHLEEGHSITETALDVGYNSPSAFTAMFRRTFGESPSRYLADQDSPMALEGQSTARVATDPPNVDE